MRQKEETREAVEVFLTLDVGESRSFPLIAYNRLRAIKTQNPQVLEARADGKEFTLRNDLAQRACILTRTR